MKINTQTIALFLYTIVAVVLLVAMITRTPITLEKTVMESTTATEVTSEISETTETKKIEEKSNETAESPAASPK